jgi:hypothetical protein
MSEEEKQKRREGMKKYVRTSEHEAKRKAALLATFERKRLAKLSNHLPIRADGPSGAA